jgi:hypothetical protein
MRQCQGLRPSAVPWKLGFSPYSSTSHGPSLQPCCLDALLMQRHRETTEQHVVLRPKAWCLLANCRFRLTSRLSRNYRYPPPCHVQTRLQMSYSHSKTQKLVTPSSAFPVNMSFRSLFLILMTPNPSYPSFIHRVAISWVL